MVIEYLECNYKCGTPVTLTFHLKTDHMYKINECACGNESLSGICISGAGSHKKNSSSSCSKSTSISNSSSVSNYNFISNSSSIFNSSSAS